MNRAPKPVPPQQRSGTAPTVPSQLRRDELSVHPQHETTRQSVVRVRDRGLDPAELPTSVLLVEDNDGDALIVKRLLARGHADSYSVSVVGCLDEARDHLLTNDVDCVLLDLSLPDAYGLQTVEGVRLAAPQAPIVVLSGLHDMQMAVASLQHGAQDYLYKGEIDESSLWRSMRYAKQRKNSDLTIRHQADHDTLTGLVNRLVFVERLQAAITRLSRSASTLAVLFMDLDGFKAINDELGHDIGDALIVEVATRLTGVVRPGDLPARLGGDEFLVLLENIGSERNALVSAERVQEAITGPFTISGHEIRVGASIGIALSEDPEADPHRLIRDADAAMYRAKSLGKGRCELFDTRLRDLAEARVGLEKDLQRAVGAGQLLVHYQPIVDLRHRGVVGAETLVRWQHPSGVLVPPDHFLAAAESTRLIVDIDNFVLHAACEQLNSWAKESGYRPVLGVNLSARQVSDPNLVNHVAAVVQDTGVDPTQLCVEVTEASLIRAEDATLANLRGLHDLGLWVGIDDFGTGYGSLTYLQRYPVDYLKIDGSFIAGLGLDVESTATVEAICGLAAVFGLTVVAEGVETEEQAANLLRLGCKHAQGFLFARPGPFADIDLKQSVRSRRCAESRAG